MYPLVSFRHKNFRLNRGWGYVVLLSVQPIPRLLALKNHKSSESQAKKNTSLKYKKYFVQMTLRRPSRHRRPITQRDCFASRRPLRRWRFPLPLGRRWEYHTLSGRHREYDALSTHWELRVLYSQRRLLRVWYSQREGTLARWRWKSIILSAGGAGW